MSIFWFTPNLKPDCCKNCVNKKEHFLQETTLVNSMNVNCAIEILSMGGLIAQTYFIQYMQILIRKIPVGIIQFHWLDLKNFLSRYYLEIAKEKIVAGDGG